jgi:hypothetical protein
MKFQEASSVRQVIRGSYTLPASAGDYDISVPALNPGKTTVSLVFSGTGPQVGYAVPSPTVFRLKQLTTTSYTVYYELVEFT